MQEERSQHRNRAKAMALLRAKLYDLERAKLDAERAAERRGQVGSGDRSERIRTYNFPQGRVTDHRINLTLYKLPQVIEGEALGEIIDALVTEHQAALLAAEDADADDRLPDAMPADRSRRAPARAGAGVRGRPGIERPDLDARMLIGHALGLDHTALAASPDRLLGRAEHAADCRCWRRAGCGASRSRASSG